MPTYGVLDGGPDDIQTYLNKEELDLSDIKTKEDIQLYSQSLKMKRYKTLRLSKSSCTMQIIKDLEFPNLFRQLDNIDSLFLPSCDFTEFPTELCFPKLRKVDMSNSALHQKVLTGIPHSVSKFVARNCYLRELPCCYHVEILDIRNNEVSNISSPVVFARLKKLVMENNRLLVVDFNRSTFPNLETLTCGSSECRFIEFSVLHEIISNNLTLELSPGTNLILPPKTSLLSTDSLKAYVNNPERFLYHLSREDAVDSLMWLVDESTHHFLSFDLSGYQIVEDLGRDRLQSMLEKESLQNIKVLNLSNVNLKIAPKINCLKQLDTVDLSQNQLTKLDYLSSHQILTKLYVEGNPISCIELNVESFPKLRYIRTGSRETHTVEKAILIRMLEGEFTLDIPEIFRAFLKFPTYAVLCGHKHTLRKYLNTHELDLSLTENGAMGIKLIEENIKKCAISTKALNVTGQISLTAKGESGLNRLLGNQNLRNVKRLVMNSCGIRYFPVLKDMGSLTYLDLGRNPFEVLFISHSLRNLQELRLNNCGLDRMFNLNHFPVLKDLDISDNRIDSNKMIQFYEKSEKVYPLEKLNVVGNPLEEINFNVKSFPRMMEIKAGSQCTKFITFPVLRHMKNNFFSIEIPSPYRKYLLLCPFKVLNGGNEAVRDYLEDTEINLSLHHQDI